MIRKIVDIKNSSLRQKALLVKKLDKKTHELIADMHETLSAQDDPEGVGLAAPQIGKSLQMFVVLYNKKQRAFINPKILSISDEETGIHKTRKGKSVLEGCLSLPHYYGPIERSKKLMLEYLDVDGEVKKEFFKGFMAHIVQHEVDHLNGILFVDRILEQKAPLYKFHGDQWEEVDLI